MDVQPENSKCVVIRPAVKIKSNDEVSQISIQEFLNFLKTAYQVCSVYNLW